MALSAQERAALCRRIASSGGQARAAKLDPQRRREIASQGFWTVVLKYGPQKALNVAYGVTNTGQIDLEAMRAKATARARARRQHPAPQLCRCGNPAAHLHHTDGALVSDRVEPLCLPHHARAEAALRYGQQYAHGV